MQDIGAIRRALKDASPFDIFLISFVALPFVLTAWITVFKDLGHGERMLQRFVYGVVGFYAAWTVVMVILTRKEKRL